MLALVEMAVVVLVFLLEAVVCRGLSGGVGLGASGVGGSSNWERWLGCLMIDMVAKTSGRGELTVCEPEEKGGGDGGGDVGRVDQFDVGDAAVKEEFLQIVF